jgi:hypothetical protein
MKCKHLAQCLCALQFSLSEVAGSISDKGIDVILEAPQILQNGLVFFLFLHIVDCSSDPTFY